MSRRPSFLTASGHVDLGSSGSRHILVVDDEKVQRLVLEKWLTSDGYEVTVAENGPQAYELLTSNTFHMVLTDMELPGFSGAELLEKVNSNPELVHIPVLLMSAADTTASTASQTILKGGEDYIFKPLIRTVVLKKVEMILANAEARERERKFTELLIRKEAELHKLRTKVSQMDTQSLAALEATETPIEAITSTLVDVLSEPSMSRDDPTRRKLLAVLHTIRSGIDLYAPMMDRVAKADPVAQGFVAEYALVDPITARRKSSTATFPTLSDPSGAAQELMNWEFDCWSLDSDEALLPYFPVMFAHFDLLNTFNINESKLEAFILAVRDNYKDNPYHNFRHAFDITQAVFVMLTAFDAGKYLTHLDILTLLTAALCHDVGHPGVNNKFMVATEDELALQYNDQSVLENHHCNLAFKLLRSEPLNFLDKLPKDQFTDFRKHFIKCVLSTDMATHFSNMSHVEARLNSDAPLNREELADRVMIMETVLHSADISNVARQWPASFAWARAVTEEFFAQGDREKALGLPVEAFMDKSKTTVAKNTSGFARFVAKKQFDLLARLLPSAIILPETIVKNLVEWDKLIAAEKDSEEPKAKAEVEDA